MFAEGWLLDCYPSKDPDRAGLTFWIKSPEGNLKLRDKNWRMRIYCAGKNCENADWIFSRVKNSGLVHSVKPVEKIVNICKEKSQALELELAQCGNGKRVADLLESIYRNPAALQLYNVDVLPEQAYFFEKDLFPLAYVRAEYDNDSQVTGWELLDDLKSYDYKTPDMRILRLNIGISTKVPRMDAKLISLQINDVGFEGSEQELLHELMAEVEHIDPDLILTQNGDAFVLPFIYSKARQYSLDLSKLNRDEFAHDFDGRLGGRSYFSYNRILYRPYTHRFFGRLHLDEGNTIIYNQCALEGLYEITRLCRMPLHTSARASIGKCLSGLQFYYAAKRNILIPYKPRISEDVKSALDLLHGDRGGLVLTPLEGIHEWVCEIDFSSLYPSIIRDYNISAETVNCSCCPPETNRIEELNMHICNKQRGLVAESLEAPIERKFEYKQLKKATYDPALKASYEERADSLKGLLVSSFGYLSYRHAKFGKIDSHMAVCSIARRTLRESIQLANLRGFKVIHGIIDSLWIYKNDATPEEYIAIAKEIEAHTGFRLTVEGIYKWIVFLPSKVYSKNQVANRYFGAFYSGELKVRGIELRRHDTPAYFKKCQQEMLTELATCDNAGKLRKYARTEGISIFEKYARALERHEVPALELLINRRLSKDVKDYKSTRRLQVNAASNLEKEGHKLRAGQSVSYIITNYKTKGMSRSISRELVAEETEYDSERYVDLLADCCATLLVPFGVSKEDLLSRSQSLLSWN